MSTSPGHETHRSTKTAAAPRSTGVGRSSSRVLALRRRLRPSGDLDSGNVRLPAGGAAGPDSIAVSAANSNSTLGWITELRQSGRERQHVKLVTLRLAEGGRACLALVQQAAQCHVLDR